MPPFDLAVLAEGDLPTGHHWILKAGGSSADLYTFLETLYPDGHRDEGGMGGPPLHPGSLMNIYTGGTERGLRRIVVRADPRVLRVRLQLADGGLEMQPLATQAEIGVSFFAVLLPETARLVSITALGADDQTLEPQDLSRQEAAWQRFLRRHDDPRG
jgi:hypothetical protein